MLPRLVLAVLSCTAITAATAAEWTVPAAEAAVANPLTSSAETIAAGRKSFVQSCQICHGSSGKGDGDGAAYLNPKPASLQDPAMAKQSDGSLFAKITAGRNTMPGWKALLNDQQRWELVVFIRTLQPQPKQP